MASFEEIMNRPMTEIKAPSAYPVGTYHCMVVERPTAGKMGQRQTDYIRFKLQIVGVGADVDQQEATQQQLIGKPIFADFFITEDASWRLKEFLVEHLGIDEGTSPSMAVDQAPGKECMVHLRHEASQDGKRLFHRIASTAHV